MRNTYIIIIALIVLVVGGWSILGAGKQAEAPVQTAPTVETSPLPEGEIVLGEAGAGEMEGAVSDVKEFTVSGNNFAFVPSVITVQKGDRVKITFENTAGFHDFVIDEYGVATKQAQAPATEVIEFTADKEGSFEYYCSVGSHRAMGMKGTLVVE